MEPTQLTNETYCCCSRCNKIFNPQETKLSAQRDSRTALWCDECLETAAFRCVKCNQYKPFDCADMNISLVQIADYCCKDCVRKVRVKCGMCGHYFTLPKLMAISTGHTRQTLCCPKCRRNKSAYEAKMKPYSHKPKALWQRGKRQKVREESRYFGFELEVAPDKEAAGPIIPIQQNLYPLLGKIEKNFPYLYTKADASLPTGGVEIVSHPFTEKWFTENQSEVVRMLKILQDENYTGDSSQCGFHIHINRRCLTQPDTGLAALNYLLIKDKPAFETFSRRRTFTYCKCRGSYEEYCEVKDLLNKWLKQGDPTAASYFLLQRLSCERNSAINTHPRRTLEWRLFQSTIKRLDFFAAVQFIFNLTDWMNTVQLTPELDTCTLDTIINLRPQPELQKYYKQFIPKITEARKKYSVPLTDGDEKENDDGDY